VEIRFRRAPGSFRIPDHRRTDGQDAVQKSEELQPGVILLDIGRSNLKSNSWNACATQKSSAEASWTEWRNPARSNL